MAEHLKILDPNYLFIKELGNGGNGIVYLARHLKQNKYVAIKVLNLDAVPNESTRHEIIYNFKREAIAISSLSHKNIVNVYDFGQENNNHFIIMEFIEGISLSKIIKLHALPFEMALRLTLQICDALNYIHRNGVIHRDIKPENIILTGKGVTKLIDFSCAKFFDDTFTENNSCKLTGTIPYMSTEQLQNSDNVDERADIYSLAVSLYEMLTGQLPFYAENTGKTVLKILNEEPLPPSKIKSGLPKSLDAIILKAISKKPQNRYSTVSQFAEEIRNFLEYQSLIETTEKQFA
jgi:serine/threonine protein kinase